MKTYAIFDNLWFFLEWEIFQTGVVDKTETHFMFNNFFFPPESRAIYETMWENTVKPDRP
jgi:hypothetical protein